VILIDSSAWIEFLRGTDSAVCRRVDDLLSAEIAITDAVRMEILAGARDDHHLGQLRGLLARATVIPTTPADYDTAAALYRTCRRQGSTVRKMVDCLIAAVALGARVPVLHRDTDFEVLARHTGMQTCEPSA
jgi:predicted nucleic acid-binding protein